MNNAEEDANLARLIAAVEDIGAGLHAIANSIHRLGTAEASTPMGAIEAHSLVVKEAAEYIGDSLTQVGDSLTHLLGDIATALERSE